MLALVVDHSHVVVVEASILVGVEEETADLVAILTGQVTEILAILLLWIGIIDHNTFAFLEFLLGHLIALLLGLEGISIDPRVGWQVVLPEC